MAKKHKKKASRAGGNSNVAKKAEPKNQSIGNGQAARQEARARRRRQRLDEEASTMMLDEFASQALSNQLAAAGLRIVSMRFDGNCLFRAVSFQLFGTQERHGQVRRDVVDAMRLDEETFAPFVEDEETFDAYCSRMAADGEWGDMLELIALSRCFRCRVVVHQLDSPSLVMQDPTLESQSQGAGATTIGADLHVSYQDGMHYNAVRSVHDDSTDAHAALPLFLDGDMYKVGGPRATAASDDNDKGKEKKKGKNNEKDKMKQAPKETPKETQALDKTVASVLRRTGCKDAAAAQALLADMEGDEEAAVEFLQQGLGLVGGDQADKAFDTDTDDVVLAATQLHL